jgi:DNA-binding MarR family transcriptional regulator
MGQMKKDTKDKIKKLAAEIKNQSQEVEIKTFINFFYTSDMVNRYVDIESANQSLNRSSATALHTLVLNGGTMTPTDLSKRLFRSKHAVTNIIDNLEHVGYVKREPIGTDRRTRAVSITEAGVDKIQSNTYKERSRLARNMLQDFNESELEALIGMLQRIRKRLLGLVREGSLTKSEF